MGHGDLARGLPQLAAEMLGIFGRFEWGRAGVAVVSSRQARGNSYALKVPESRTYRREAAMQEEEEQ